MRRKSHALAASLPTTASKCSHGLKTSSAGASSPATPKRLTWPALPTSRRRTEPNTPVWRARAGTTTKENDMTTKKEIAKLTKMKLNELQAKFAEVVGEKTRSPNRKFLMRKIAETLRVADASAKVANAPEDAAPDAQ